MIKIAHIGRPIAGVGVYIQLLTKYIDNRKFSNILICNKKENIILPKDKSGNFIQTYHVNFFRKIRPLADLKSLIKTIKILKKENPDIIHCHSAKPGIIGRIAGLYLKKKVFYTPHAYSFLSAETKIKKGIFLTIERIFRYTQTKTLACSTSEYNRALKQLKINEKKVYLWNNSIEENIQIEDSIALNLLPKNFICSIGRPSYQKNLGLLIESVFEVKKSVKDIHLVILGAGENTPDLKKIKNKIKENNLEDNVTIIPWLERSKTLAILHKSQFYVSTSLYEGLPYSLIEALALSKPCIVTNVDGNKDLVTNNINGFLVSLNKTEIAKKIIFLHNNPDQMSSMSKNSRKEYLEKYNIINNISHLEKIYLQ